MLKYLHRTFAANPLFGRQLATSFSGPKLGLAFLLVNIVLFLVYMILFIYFMEEGTLFTNDEAVPLAYFWHNTILYFLLAILLPIKISGFIEGPRVNRAFDQIVVTGVSPLKFFFGAWFSGMAYAAILLLVSIPYLGCLYLIAGEMGVARFVGGYAILFAYSNVVILVTLAMSVLGREWGMVPLCILGFVIAGIFGLIIEPDWVWGYPTHIAEVTPARLFWRQTEPFYLWSWNMDRTRALIYGDPVLFSTAIPLNLYTALLWMGLGCVSIAIIVLGPAHRFSPGLNNFGTAILPGDRKKRFFRRLRGGLTRRVELAFFYENRARPVERWGYLTRVALGFLPVILVWGVILGRAYGGYPVPYGDRGGFFDDETMHTVTILSGIVLFLWVLYHCDGRHEVHQRVAIGRFMVPRELTLYIGFAILLSALFYIHYSTMGVMQTNYTISRDYLEKSKEIAMQQQQAGSMADTVLAVLPANFRPTDMTEEQYAQYFHDWWIYIPGFLVLLANLFLMTRVVTRVTQSPLVARFLALACTLATIFLPMVILGLVFNEMLPVSFVKLGGLSPLILVEDIFGRMLVDQRVAMYFTSHLVFGGSLGLLLGTLHLLAWRNGRRLAAKLSLTRSSVATAALIVLFASALVRAQDDSSPQGVGEAGGDAQDSPPALDLVLEKVARGFMGRVFAENIDFYTAVVRNDSDETIRGRYWVDDEDRYRVGWKSEKREFELGPGTTKVFRWGASSSFDPYRGYRNPSGMTRVVFEAEGKILKSRALGRDFRGQQQQRGNSNPQQRVGSFLFVAPRRVAVTDGWSRVAMAGNASNAVSCAVEFLPERAGFYLGLDAVIVGPADHEWTRRQRDALYDYVRLGGSVVLQGDVHRSGLPVAGPWEDLFRGSESRDLRLGSGLILLEQQEDGRDVFHVPDPVGGASVPLLNVRSVGAGHVSHLGFSLDGSPMTVPAGGNFWPDFDRAMPRSRFPLVPSNPMWWSDRTLDLSSLFLILGYFLGYSLLFSGSLIFFFRKRRRRVILWSLVVGVPLLFVAFVPALNAFMHSRPSLTEVRDLAFFGPGSSRGVTISQVTVRSSGRQKHEVELSGRELSVIAFSPRASYRYGYDALPDLDYGAGEFDVMPRPGTSRDFDLGIEMVSWTSRAFEVFGTYKLDRPVKSRAELYRAAGKLSFEVELPFDLPVERAFILLQGFHSEYHFQQLPVELDLTRGNVLKSDLSLEKTFLAASPYLQMSPSSFYFRAMQTIDIPGGMNIAWNLRARRRVFLAVSPGPDVDLGMEMRSDDIAFETPSSVHAYMQMRKQNQWYAGRIDKRDGEYVRNLRYRLFVFELPLEER